MGEKSKLPEDDMTKNGLSEPHHEEEEQMDAQEEEDDSQEELNDEGKLKLKNEFRINVLRKRFVC